MAHHPFFADGEAEARASADPPFDSTATSLRPRRGETAEQTVERVTKAVRDAEERKLHAREHVVRLLTEAEAVLTGWILKHDTDAISKLIDPLYDLCDEEASDGSPS